MSSCCGNSNVPSRTLIPATSYTCSVPGDVCGEAVCSMFKDDRLAGAPAAASLTLLGRMGNSYYVLATDKDGFVVCKSGAHRVVSSPDVPLPLLRKFIPAEDGSSQIQATPEGVPIEDFPPTAAALHVQNSRGVWYGWRGPTDQEAIAWWNGYDFEFRAPETGRVKGPLELVDEIILMGTENQAGCDTYEAIKKLNPRGGFIIGNGTKHTTLPCADERQAPEDGLEVFALMACTNKGPRGIQLPAAGILSMCGGNLKVLESPQYTTQDFTDGKIPSGKKVGDFIAGVTLQTDGNGCLAWKLTDLASNALKLIFNYTGTRQGFVVPSGVTKATYKVWGAGGSNDEGARGGAGGFSEAVFSVTGGQEFTVIVGFSPYHTGPGGANFPDIYGFGGLGSPDSNQEPGGGLSGIFTGSADVVETDDSRAIIIAGGGGAGGATGINQNYTSGGNGNAGGGGTGGMPHFHGSNATNGDLGTGGSGGGGGGWRGGTGGVLMGWGGSGYINPSRISGNVVASPDSTVPGSSDAEYDSPAGQQNGGHGRVVVIFS